jgi:hypothetical protein
MLCARCGSRNDATSIVCKECGAGLSGEQTSSSRVERIINEPEPSTRHQANYPPPQQHWPNTPPVMQMPAMVLPPPPVGYRCPFCQSPNPPFIAQKVSVGGWITFVVMLLFCFPLCWIGILMKENYRICSTCGMTFG